MTSDDVCVVTGPMMWIGGDEGKYTKMLVGHKSQKTSGIKMQMSIYEQVEPLRRAFCQVREIVYNRFMCASFCLIAAAVRFNGNEH